jgi:Spy/CpxP family protein refolding chaperone
MRNKWMKTIAIGSALTFGCLSAAAVQAADLTADVNPTTTRRVPDAGAFPMLQRVRVAVRSLGLTEDTQAKIDQYFDQAQSDLQQIRSEGATDRKEAARRSREVFNTLRQNIAAHLDDQQRAALEKKLRPVRRDLFSRIQSTVQRLQLSREQQEKLGAILQDAQKQLQDAGDKVQAGGDDLQALLRDAQRLSNVLTEEQKQTLRDLLRQDGPKHDDSTDPPAPKDHQ